MAVFFLLHSSKYGDFDGWALWNTHAKFLLHPEIWTRIFLDKSMMSHSDYPLMLPAIVAFFWKVINTTSFFVPVILSFSFVVTIPLLLYYALKDEFPNKLYAYFAMFILVIDYNFQVLNTSQCADLLLSIFILLVFVLHHHLKSGHLTAPAYVLGFACACCTWVKNEGDLFFTVFTLVFLITNYKNFAHIKKYLVGCLLPIMVTISFKYFFSPTNDLMAANNHGASQLIGKIEDVSRYVTIIKLYFGTFVDRFWIAMVLVFLLFFYNRPFFRSFAFVVFFSMLIGFTFIYVITPYNLGWHVYTSFYRLLYQIYPALIFTSVVSLNKISAKGSFKIVH